MALTKYTTGSSGPDHLTRPPEYKPLPKPKPRSSGPDHLTRPAQGYGPVVRQAAPAPAPRQMFQVVPVANSAAYPVTSGVSPVPFTTGVSPVPITLAPERPVVEVVPEPTPLELAGVFASRDPRTLDAALRSTWSNLENESVSGLMKERETGRLPQTQRRLDEGRMIAMAEAMNAQAQRGKRDAARREREANDREEQEKPLTLEEWNAYSPLQQAAVQANADLAAAVRRDFSTMGKHRGGKGGSGAVTKEDRAANLGQLGDYQSLANSLFGESGQLGYKGLEYAPNTVAFLKSRGISRQDLAGRTLDDLISGDALYSKRVVDQLGKEVPAVDPFKSGPQRSPRDRNIAFAQALAKGQLQYQEKIAAQLKKGDQILTGMTARGTSAEANAAFGAKEMRDEIKPTAIRPETQQQIEKYMEALARPDRDLGETMEIIKMDLEQIGAGQQEIDQVYQTLQDRARLGMQGGRWFPDVDYKLRGPDEVAQALGVPTLKRKSEG